MDINPMESAVGFRSMSTYWTAGLAVKKIVRAFVVRFRKPKARACPRAAACGTKEIPLRKELNSHEVCARIGVNRIKPETLHTEETQRGNQIVVTGLNEAINLQQSDHVADAREKLQHVFQTVRNLGQRFFGDRTNHGLTVLGRGKDLFLQDSVSCSVRHGTLLLDSSNCGAQFYSSLLNVIGAFAVVISEFKMAKETFSMLIDFHQQSDETSRKHDLGAAYNNRGCISLILGDLKQAECDFKTSIKHLESAKERHQQHSPLLEAMSIAINSNIGRLHLISRDYSMALVKQVQLVETCKSKKGNELSLQVVFTLLNNLAVLYTTLGKFSKAEQELKWMVSYCYQMDREDCNYLLNFVALHRSEVLLFHGKTKEAEKAFTLDIDDIDLVEMFGGLHMNVRIETVEKLVDVILLKGNIRFARQILETGVKILKSTFGPDHFNVASLLYKQGTVLALAGEVSSAVEKFKCSVKILEEIFGIKHPLLLKCYMSLGELALRSKMADESYFYFQRVIENIEAIFQVSFVNQLSRAYLEMTNSNTFQPRTMPEDTHKIEGLVAEHGLVLAVLLSRLVVQDDTLAFRSSKKLDQPIASNNRGVNCPYSREVTFFKYTRDFLQTGQAFFRQGMKKEAATFFQQAKKYFPTLDTTRDPTYTGIARLYDVLTKELIASRQTMKNQYEMSNCIEELSEVSTKCKRSTEEATTTVATASATIDDQLNLKLVLIFLILLSIELKMMDTTFVAYDLYSRISQNEDGFLHVLNGENQFYVSKTLLTCNGKTALQDVLVSTFSLIENDYKQPPPDKELYRSLAFKKNVPTDSFLVAYTSSVFLDIKELRALDRKISLSVQECFTQKCLETSVENSATQVVVDLTTTTYTRDYRNVLLTGSRIELLSLCLLQGTTSEIYQGGNISEISTAMYVKTVRFTFEDEHTSHFMFSKNALYLLQQCNPGKISTMSVQHQCLSLTITHPIKVRLTLWRKDKSISQKVQFVQTETRHGVADRTEPRQRCPGEQLEDVGVEERVFGPAIDYLANAYQVSFIPDVEHSDEPPDVSDVHCEQRGFLLDGWQPKERQLFSLIREQSDCLRLSNLNASVLEGLTVFSELSRQLHGGTIHEGEDDIVVDADTETEDVRCLPTTSQSQIEQEVTSSDVLLLTLNPEANIQNPNLSLEATNLAGEEVTTETCETYPIPREEEDEEHDNLLGRNLFEKDRDSRRSWVIELHHEITRKSNVMNEQDGLSGEVTEQVNNSVIGLQNAGKYHTTNSPNYRTRMDISNSSFETSSTEAELRTQNFIQPQSNQGPKNDEKAMERHLNKKDTASKGASIAKSNGRKMEEILPTWNEKVYENEGSAEDQGFYENQQFESSAVPGQSGRRVKEEVKQSLTDAAIDYSITRDVAGNTTSDHQYRSNSLSFIHGQTQHHYDVQRKTKHPILKEETGETISTIEKREEYIFQRRDKRESSDGQDELLVNEDFSQVFTPANMKKRETSRFSFNIYDDTVPDGPVTEISDRIHDSSIDSRFSTNTNVVDELLKRPGNNLRVQSLNLPENATGILTSRGQFVDENCCKELLRGNEKLRTFEKNEEEVSFQTPQLAFLGGDVLVDGGTTDSPRKEDEIVDSPILTGESFTTCQDGTEGIFKHDLASFQSNTAKDDVDGRVYSPKSDTNVNDPPGFGGARPKEKSRNSTRRNSSSKKKMSELIQIFQPNETEETGVKPSFLARHTIKSNGVTMDLPSHDGWDEPYFSALSCKNIVYGDNLRLPGEGINPLGYTSSFSSQGLYDQTAFAVATSTRGNAQSLAIHQKPSLNQKESWHFPPLESPNVDESLRVSQKNPCQSGNSLISNVEAPFGGHGSRSTYDEMDSMSNEFLNSMGNVDNGMVKSSTVSDHHSSTEDSTSSLLGSLQQVMSNTINLIASSNVAAKQPQKEPKEAVKLSIQEEARGSREQEQAVRIGAEDSRNQEESTQDNETTERQHILTPVQETPRPVCSHYQRRCLVRFPCCGKFYPCHRCHNESKDCSDDQARASNATHIRCSICYHEQVIDEQSQNCGSCKSKMSEYFCATCKHFTSVDKNPFHCDKCGICRIHRDRSFHCDVCNVCLDKRLQGKHKCRPDSGHDECCICLEDAFSGCQILPCSHKVHKDCAIAMIQNGVRSCPICRHPLFSQPQNSPQ